MQMTTWILKVGILTDWGNEMLLYSSVMMLVGYRWHKNGDLILVTCTWLGILISFWERQNEYYRQKRLSDWIDQCRILKLCCQYSLLLILGRMMEELLIFPYPSIRRIMTRMEQECSNLKTVSQQLNHIIDLYGISLSQSRVHKHTVIKVREAECFSQWSRGQSISCSELGCATELIPKALLWLMGLLAFCYRKKYFEVQVLLAITVHDEKRSMVWAAIM